MTALLFILALGIFFAHGLEEGKEDQRIIDDGPPFLEQSIELKLARRNSESEPELGLEGPIHLSLCEVEDSITLHVQTPQNPTGYAVTFPNTSIPHNECRGVPASRWNRCNMLLILGEVDEDHFVLFATTGSIIVTQFDFHFLSLLNSAEIDGTNLPCQPTTLWLEHGDVHAACLYINSSYSFELYRLKLNLNKDALNESFYQNRQLVMMQSYPEALSNFLANINFGSCSENSPSLVFAWAYDVYKSIDGKILPSIPVSDRCHIITELEKYDEVSVSTMCSNKTLETLNQCTGGKQYSNLTLGLPRVCAQSTDTMFYVYYDRFSLKMEGSEQLIPIMELSTENVTDSTCVKPPNATTVFLIVESNNATVSIIQAQPPSIHILTTNNTVAGTAIEQVLVWEEQYIGYGNGTHFLLHHVQCLHQLPQYTLPYVPNSNFMCVGNTIPKCAPDVIMTSSILSIPVTATVQGTPIHPSQTITIHSSDPTVQPPQTTPTKSTSTKSDNKSELVAFIVVPVLLVVLVLVPVVICVCYWCCKKFIDSKNLRMRQNLKRTPNGRVQGLNGGSEEGRENNGSTVVVAHDSNFSELVVLRRGIPENDKVKEQGITVEGEEVVQRDMQWEVEPGEGVQGEMEGRSELENDTERDNESDTISTGAATSEVGSRDGEAERDDISEVVEEISAEELQDDSDGSVERDSVRPAIPLPSSAHDPIPIHAVHRMPRGENAEERQERIPTPPPEQVEDNGNDGLMAGFPPLPINQERLNARPIALPIVADNQVLNALGHVPPILLTNPPREFRDLL